MKFQTTELTATTILIERDEHVVAGSIVRVGDHWHVEILWSGPEGDIVYDTPTLAAALAFVDGVGEGFEA
jgi:hypothetical protein